MTLRSLRCKLWTGASWMSLLSLRTGGRVKVISYLCRIFRKPTYSNKGEGETSSLWLLLGHQGMPPRPLVGPSICFPGKQRLLLSSCSRPFNNSFPLRLMAQAIPVVQIYCLATNAISVGQGPWELFGMKGQVMPSICPRDPTGLSFTNKNMEVRK